MMIERTGSYVNQSLRQLKDSTGKPSALVEKARPKGNKKPEEETFYTIKTHEKTAIENNKEKFKTTDVHSVKVKSAEDVKIAAEIRRLKMWEEHAKDHERQHQLVGGEFAGSPSYTYTIGPDGKRYISGGEVSMYIPAGSTPEDSLAALERVKRAATAPADPSPQDIKTAAMASAKQASIRMSMLKKQGKEAYEHSRQQELQLKEMKGDVVDPISRFKFNEFSAFELFI